MTTEGTNGDDSASPEPTGSAGRPTVRRALVAAGELNPGSARRPQPTREARAGAERASERTAEVVAQPRTSASAAVSATAPPAGNDTDGPAPAETTVTSGDDPPESPDSLAAENGEGPREPTRRRTKYLLAAAGVGAVLLVVLPLVIRGHGSADDKNTAAASSAGSTTAPPSPDSSLIGLPKNLKTASATPTKHSGTTTRPSPSAVVSHAVASHSAAAPSGSAQTPKKPTTSVPSAKPTSLVIKPIAKLVNGAPWKTNRMQLGMQTDGNLVLYDLVKKRVLWAAGTSGQGNSAFFQDDGNLVVYNTAQHAVWASNPAGFTNATLVLRSDGNLVIMAGGKQVWATNTHF